MAFDSLFSFFRKRISNIFLSLCATLEKNSADLDQYKRKFTTACKDDDTYKYHTNKTAKIKR